MADRTARLRVVVDSDTKGAAQAEAALEGIDKSAVKAGKSLSGIGDQADGASNSFKKLGDNSKAATREIKTHADSVRVLREQYKQTQAKIRELNVDLLRGGGSESIIRRQLRSERSELRDLTRIGRELGIDIGKAMADGASKTFLSSLQGGLSTPVLGPAIAGAIGGLITVIGPGLGALLGGTITGALGTGAMAAGILSAAKNSEVKAAAKQFGEEISDEFFTGTAFIKPILAGLDILKQGFRDLGINALLAPLAPTVITIAHGIADFVNNLKDAGLSATFSRMESFAHIAAEGLASAGDALGFFFDEISKDKGAMDGLRAFFAILNGTVKLTAIGINVLEKAFHAFSVAALGAATLANKISFGHLDELQRGAERILGIAPKVSGQMVYMSNSAHEVQKRTEAEAEALKELANALDEARQAVNRFMGIQLNMDEANLAVKKGLLDLKETLAENRGAWDDNTAAGQAHRQALLDHLGVLERQREAMAAATGDWAAADVQYLKGLDDLKKIAIQSGITGAALEAMMRDYRLRILADVVINAAPALGNWLAEAFGQFFGKKRARGGPVRAGEAYVVGEERPEMFVPTQDGVIIPDVPRSGAPGTAVGIGASSAVTVYIDLTGDDDLLRWLRKKIRVVGGTGTNSVQLALGRTA